MRTRIGSKIDSARHELAPNAAIVIIASRTKLTTSSIRLGGEGARHLAARTLTPRLNNAATA
jgi:hypothetical protein